MQKTNYCGYLIETTTMSAKFAYGLTFIARMFNFKNISDTKFKSH